MSVLWLGEDDVQGSEFHWCCEPCQWLLMLCGRHLEVV